MWQELFQSGSLLLPESPSPAPLSAESGFPLSANILTLVFVLLLIMQLKRFFELVPSLLDSVFRARGSFQLENSYRLSHDRTVLSLTFIIPAVLLVFRYRLYNPAFLQGLDSNLYLAAIVGLTLGYILLRLVLFLWLRPRKYRDQYNLAGRLFFTFFILLMLLVLTTVGICVLVGVNDFIIRDLIYIESAFVYGIFLVRRAQILSLFCNPFRTFLYLCGLEFFPTALLVVSAVVL